MLVDLDIDELCVLYRKLCYTNVEQRLLSYKLEQCIMDSCDGYLPADKQTLKKEMYEDAIYR